MAMQNVFAVYETAIAGWERAETKKGVPYYICQDTEKTSWDHPYLIKILEELNDYNEIKYAAYRTAFKIRYIQRNLHMHQVHLTTVKDTFHLYGYTEGIENIMSSHSLLSLITSLYTSRETWTGASNNRFSIFAEVLQNFLIALFDRKRTGCISVLSVKLVLILLSAARLADKYKALYLELKDPSTFISVRRFKFFIETIVQLPTILSEGNAFGTDVSAAASSCIQMNSSHVGISEDMFYGWLLREPQTIVWLPTFHRVIASETVTHESKCSICKSCPIQGFRYKCLQCFNFDMCQSCFFTGRTRKNHKLKHPIQEYCIVSSVKVDAKAFIKTIRNNLSKKYRRKSRLKYLPVMSENKPDAQTGCNHSESCATNIPIAVLTENSRRIPVKEDLKYKAVALNTKGTSNQTCQVHPEQRKSCHLPLDDKENQKPKCGIPAITLSKPLETKPQEMLLKQPVVKGMKSDYIQPDLLVEQQRDLEKVISKLEEENRKLQQQLNNIKEISDTESNMSIKVDLQKQKKARMEDCYSPLHVQTQSGSTSQPSQHSVQPYHTDSIGLQPISPISCGSDREEAEGNSQRVTYSHIAQSHCHDTHMISPGIQYSENSHADNGSPKYRYRTSTKDDISILPDSTQDYISNLQDKDFSPDFNIQPRQRRVTGPESGTTQQMDYDSLDDIDASPSHFTLPSFANSLDNLDGKDEMDLMVQRLDKVFPSNLSYSAYSVLDTEEPDEMIQAASTIGNAMSQLVSEAIQAKYA